MNYKLQLTYDGTNYAGWQRQQNAVTVQGELERVLSVITREPVTLTGVSRTDAGVHAVCYTANAHLNNPVDAYKLCRGANALLAPDIRLCKIVPCSENFSARFDTETKTYLYHIDTSSYGDPFYRQYAWHVPALLDDEKISCAASYFLGEHDFSAFMAQGGSAKTFTRTITESEIYRQNHILTYKITGNGFLYNMVRIIVGTLIWAGKGKIDPNSIPDIIASKDRTRAGMTAPAKGLMLFSAQYPEEHILNQPNEKGNE